MPSRTIASLDAWLARAEEVLAEQREHAISPSLVPLEGDGRYEWNTTLAALSDGLEGLLESLCSRPGRWILIVEDDRRRHLFWQALCYEDSSLVTEVVSNTYLDGDDQWSSEEEARLLALGWEPPRLPGRPNFISVEATTSPDTDVARQRAVATLRELFELGSDDEVFIKLFSSTIRGDTPASPEYSTEEDASPLPERASSEGDIPTTSAEEPLPQIAHHYFRPNLDASDEELEEDIRAWLDVVPVRSADGGASLPTTRSVQLVAAASTLLRGPQQIQWVDPQAISDPFDGLQGQVSLPSLHPTHVGPMDLEYVGHGLLAEVPCLSVREQVQSDPPL